MDYENCESSVEENENKIFNPIISEQDLTEEILITHKVFNNVRLILSVENIVYKQPIFWHKEYYNDAETYPDHLSIYYTSAPDFIFSGYASQPAGQAATTQPLNNSRGIIINRFHTIDTMAHEIGHYFGLLHTFEEDVCQDTFIQFGTCNQLGSVNCRNLMNYCSHNPKYITQDQINIMKYLLDNQLSNHVIFKTSMSP